MNKNFWIAFGITAALIIRLEGLITAPLWYDESFSLYISRLPLMDLLRYEGSDFNPPLWNLLIKLVNAGPLWLLRLPSYLSAIVSLWLVYLLTVRMAFTRTQQVMALVLVGFLPGLYWMAQDARVYAWLGMLYLLAILLAWDGRPVWLVLVNILIMYSHNTGGALVAGAVALAIYRHRERWPLWLLTGFMALVAWLPWAIRVPAVADNFWLFDLSANWLAGQSVLALFGGAQTPGFSSLAFWVMLVAFLATMGGTIGTAGAWINGLVSANAANANLTLGLLNIPFRFKTPEADPAPKTDDGPIIPTALVFGIPFGVMLVVSLSWHNVILYRTLMLLVMPFVLWIAAATAPRRLTVTTWIMPAAWVLLLAVSNVTYNPVDRGGMPPLDQAAETIRESWQEGDQIVHVTGTSALPMRYYTGDLPALVLDRELTAPLMQTQIQTAVGLRRGPLPTAGRWWLVWARDDGLIQPAVTGELQRLTAGLSPLVTVRYWQAAPIEIYLMGSNEQ